MFETCTSREDLHKLVERIPEGDVATARKFLRSLLDPVESALLAAPPDDEPMSEHESAAWDLDERRRQRGEAPVSHEEVLGEMGLTESDLR